MLSFKDKDIFGIVNLVKNNLTLTLTLIISSWSHRIEVAR